MVKVVWHKLVLKHPQKRKGYTRTSVAWLGMGWWTGAALAPPACWRGRAHMRGGLLEGVVWRVCRCGCKLRCVGESALHLWWECLCITSHLHLEAMLRKYKQEQSQQEEEGNTLGV